MWKEVSQPEGPANFGFAIVCHETNPDIVWVVPGIIDQFRVAVATLCVYAVPLMEARHDTPFARDSLNSLFSILYIAMCWTLMDLPWRSARLRVICIFLLMKGKNGALSRIISR